jgi:RNA polymerase sigma-70 factor (ECF subfamily)
LVSTPDPPAADPLSKLLVLVARQDRVAFRGLYEQIGPTLLSLCRLICNDDDVAQDVLHEVFLRIWRHAHRFDPARGPALAWLTAIARNHALDSQKRRAIREADPKRRIEWHVANIGLDKAPEKRDLVRCLRDLRPEYRQAVLLAALAGCSADEVAERLQVPLGTAKSWIRRGLLRLAECLER